MSEKLITASAVIYSGYTLHPYAAAGAAFGCCFYLATPSTMKSWRRMFYGLFSWGIGYGVGAYFFDIDQPRSVGALMTSAAVAAMAAVVFGALHKVADSNSPLPPWLSDILDRIPFFKRGGSSNGD